MNIKFLSILAIFFTFTLSGCSDDEPDEDTMNSMRNLVHSLSKPAVDDSSYNKSGYDLTKLRSLRNNRDNSKKSQSSLVAI